MIEIKGLSKKFKDVHALRGLDFSFNPGTVTGILGPNGCGKTTLIKAILGLIIPDAGTIQVANQRVHQCPDYRVLIGYMPQISQYPGHLTIQELLTMIEDIRGRLGPRKEELIDLFEMRNYLHKPMGQLSGGTRQKASAIMAFMFEPQILILDEPSVGLDPVAVVRLKHLITDAAQKGRTILLVTHMLAEIEQLVTQMYFMLDGNIKFSGTLNEIKHRAGTEALDEAVYKLMSRHYQKEVML